MQALRKGIVLAAFTLWLAPAISPAQQAKPAAPAAAAAARNEAGKIELVNGLVTITAPDRSRRTPRQGEMLYEGDAVATGADGELQAEMLDSGVIAVRPNTEMSITKYQAEGTGTDTSIFGLVKGSFRSITGWIGKNNPARYRINTPTATVGVRGTDHEPLVIPTGSTLGEPGTYDKVAAGGSYIQGKTGRVDVSPGKTGFFSFTGRDRPRVLAANPSFFRPSRNEARLEGRHDRLRPVLEQRRTERQNLVRERRTQRAQERGQGGPGAQGARGAAQSSNPQAQQRREAIQARREAARAEQPGARAQTARPAQSGAQQQAAPQARQQAAQERRQEAQNQRQQAQAQRQSANQQNADERRRRAEQLRHEREQQRTQRRESR